MAKMTKAQARKACWTTGTQGWYTVMLDNGTTDRDGHYTPGSVSGMFHCDDFREAMALQRAIRKAMTEDFK